MDNLKIEKTSKTNKSITRTIRIGGLTFDKINDLADKHETSFNCVINQIIEFGLQHIEDIERETEK